MNRSRIRKLVAFVMALGLLASLLPMTARSASAAVSSGDCSGQGTSVSANYGIRDVVCTKLSDQATAFYTGSYAYSTLSGYSGSSSSTTSSTLYTQLKSMMTSTHTNTTSYAGTTSYYGNTDCEQGNSSTLTTFYSDTSVSSTWDSGTTYNREHVWPQSLGSFTTSNAGSDLHHLRPTVVAANSARGNSPFGVVSGGTSTYFGKYTSSMFEPNDNVKGDIARILLYVYVRWGETNLTDVITSTTLLLSWMQSDPVDTWEMGRNDVVQNINGNRNVFIDYPELAWKLFGQTVPSGYQTPSSGSGSSSTSTPTATTTAAASATATATAASGSTTYTLVTSTDDLVAGGKYLIVGVRTAGTVWVLNTTQNGNNRSATQLTDYSTAAATITVTDSTAEVLTLGGSSGAWTFETGSAAGSYLGTTSNTSSNLMTTLSSLTSYGY